MAILAAFLYVAAMPMALHHIDNVIDDMGDGRRFSKWRVIATLGWPVVWPPLYAWAVLTSI